MKQLILLCIFLSTTIQAQKNFSITFGMTDKTSDQGWKLHSFMDGYLIMDAEGCDSDSLLYCMGLFRLDKDFNILWKKEIQPQQGEFSLDCKRFSILIEDSTIVAFTSVSTKNKDVTLRVQKFDKDGTIFLQKDLAIPAVVVGVFGIETSKRGYNISFLQKNFGFYRNVGLAVLDKDFNILKYKMVGDSNYYSPRCRTFDDGQKGIFLVQQLVDPLNLFYISISKVDTSLNKLWASYTDRTNLWDGEPCVDKKGDTIYVVWRHENTHLDTAESQPKIILFDTAGYKINEYILRSQEYKWAWIINVQKNKDLILTGTSYSVLSGRGWFYVCDSTGKTKINRTITDVRYGETCILLDAIRRSDGNYVLVGKIRDTIPSLTPPNNIRSRIWLLTLDSMGCWNGNCRDTIYIDVRTDVRYLDEYSTSKLSVFPNPVHDKLTISTNLQNNSDKTDLILCDLTGRELLKTTLADYAYIGYMDVSKLAAGMYVVQLKSKGQVLATEKVVIY